VQYNGYSFSLGWTMSEKKEVRKTFTPNYHLREAREQKGWSQKDVADRIRIPDTRTIGRWERGESFPQPINRQALSDIFGKSIEELGLLKPGSKKNKAKEASSVTNEPVTDPLWNVPTFLSTFVGREQDIAKVRTFLQNDETRLVTLLGPGGIGKTRLAVEVARQLRGSFDAGICFVSFVGVVDHSLVLPAIVQALAIQERGDTPLLDHLRSFLREKRLLLILDNFEQIVDSALLIEKLLAALPGLKVLVTSREVLHLQAEQEFPLASLAVPDLNPNQMLGNIQHSPSVSLFVQRAQAVLASFQLTRENGATIAQICRQLDGLPLAIELAAARSKMLPPQELLKQITERRFQILQSEMRSLPERHSALYKTVKWSYDLLSERERWLFGCLAIFNGGCTLEAVELVCGLQEQPYLDAFRGVMSLLDKSLLRRSSPEGETPRYMMLETIRKYGLERLYARDEWKSCQQAHAAYYLALVERAEPHLKSVGQIEWVALLEREKENLRTALNSLIENKQVEQALRFCEAFGKFCGLRGYWSEEQHWLEVVLSLAETTLPTQALGRVLRRAGHLAYRFRHLTRARRLFEQSEHIARMLDDQVNLAGGLVGLGLVLYRQKEMGASEERLRESVEVARRSGDNWALTNSLAHLGRFVGERGDMDEAAQLLGESIVLARELEDRENLARILHMFVTIEITRGNIAQAASCAQESFALAQALGNKPMIALAFESLAEIAFCQQEYPRAAELIECRMLLADELDDTSTIAAMRLKLGEIALKQGALVSAHALVQESLEFFHRQEDHSGLALALALLGEIRQAQKLLPLAIDAYRDALLLNREMDEQHTTSRCLLGLLEVLYEQGRIEPMARLLGFVQVWFENSKQMQLAPGQQGRLKKTRQILTQTDLEVVATRGAQMTSAALLDYLINL
jgi:predicted ATPase